MSKVLVVEPDAVLAKIYSQAIMASGHQVMTASNAQTAIDAADKLMPEVVVLEMQLAGHNGLEFLYEFRSYTDWQKVPVIVHSMVPPSQFIAAAGPMAHLNIAGYFYKPQISLSKLIGAVERLSLLQHSHSSL